MISKKVLIIDNDINLSKTLSEQLTNAGFKAFYANDFFSGFDILNSIKIDLIILDDSIKSQSGQKMLLSIKQNVLFSDLPIIVISYSTQIKPKVFALISGANDYIIKPYDFDELLARVKIQCKIIDIQHKLIVQNDELNKTNLLNQKLAMTDDLTGIYNKRYFSSRIKNEIIHSKRYNEPLSLLIMDIDHFKNINDTYGHMVGDIVLKEVSALILNCLRESDIFSRYGGEEFIAILPNTTLEGSKTLAERVRQKVESACIKTTEHNISVTISIGITRYIPTNKKSIQHEINNTIKNADIALYKAKSDGRNTIKFFPDNHFMHHNK